MSRLYQRARSSVRRRFVEPALDRSVRALRREWNHNRDYDPVFLASAMGSGTSLLALLLGQRFENACVIYESARAACSR